MSVVTKRKYTVAVLVVLWAVIVYLRYLFTVPGHLTWFIGVLAAGATMLVAGYVLRGAVERRN